MLDKQPFVHEEPQKISSVGNIREIYLDNLTSSLSTSISMSIGAVLLIRRR